MLKDIDRVFIVGAVFLLAGTSLVACTAPDPSTRCPLAVQEVDAIIGTSGGRVSFTELGGVPDCSYSYEASQQTVGIYWYPDEDYDDRVASIDSGDIIAPSDSHPELIRKLSSLGSSEDNIIVSYLVNVGGTPVYVTYAGPTDETISGDSTDVAEATRVLDDMYSAASESGWNGVLAR